MSTRNTPVLREVVDVLFTEVDEQATALAKLSVPSVIGCWSTLATWTRLAPTLKNYGYGSQKTNARSC